jgi:hypothetical protein
MATQNQNTITWQAHEFKHYEKNYGWYVVMVSVSVLIIGFFAIQRDYFASVCLAIMACLVYFFSKQTPEIVEIELSSKHIRFGRLLFPYQQIKHFWIVNNPRHKTVNLHTTAALNNIIILELEDQDPDEVRDYLLRHVPEHTETDETTVQMVMHRLKF